MSDLTPRQTQILRLVQRFIAETGMPPTRAEIARELGFRSANAAEEHLRALARKGVIALVPGTSRGIQLRDTLREQMGLPLIAVGAWLATSRKPSSTSDQHQPHILPGHGQGDPPPGQRRGGRQAARFLPTLDHNGSPKSRECSHRNQDRRGIRVH